MCVCVRERAHERVCVYISTYGIEIRESTPLYVARERPTQLRYICICVCVLACGYGSVCLSLFHRRASGLFVSPPGLMSFSRRCARARRFRNFLMLRCGERERRGEMVMGCNRDDDGGECDIRVFFFFWIRYAVLKLR